jgi:hypothetical protein
MVALTDKDPILSAEKNGSVGRISSFGSDLTP